MSPKFSNTASFSQYLQVLIFVFFAVIVVAGSFLLTNIINSENQRYQDAQRSEVVQYAGSLRADVEQSLNQRLFLIAGLRSFVVASNYQVTESSFQNFSEALVDNNESVRSVQLAPAGVVTYVYPLEGNEAAIGHDLLVDDVRRDSVYQAIENNTYIVTGPITLLQGGTALIARQPIYTPESASSSANTSSAYSLDTFWGFATVLIDIDVIYDVITAATDENGYEVAIRGTDSKGEAGSVFYGPESLFESDPILKSVQLPVGSWQIAVVPKGGWQTESPVSFWLLVIGIVSLGAILTLSLVIMYSLKRKGGQITVTTKPIENTKYVLALDIVVTTIVLLVSGYALYGWQVGFEAYQMFSNGEGLINPITALCFMLFGISILFRHRIPLVVRVLSVGLFSIVFIRILGAYDLLAWNIDLVFWRETILNASVPARMSVYTSFSFLVLALALLCDYSQKLKHFFIPRILLGVVSLFSGVVIFEFLFSSISVFDLHFFFSTSLLTAILFFLVSLYTQLTYSGRDINLLSERIAVFGGFLFCIIIASLFASASTNTLQQEAENNFLAQVERITLQIENRLDIYINVLEGGVGLFAATDNVDRDEWRAYTNALNLSTDYPGIQGMGYAIFVTPEQKEAYERSIQEEGFPGFSIRPAGVRDMYTSITYLEPFDERNRQAFGFDMWQEENRHTAMAAARDTGEAAMSNRITLVQETDSDVQAGFLVYVPQYKNNESLNTVIKRQENIVGYVYSPFRMGDLMEGILNESDLQDVRLAVYDGETVSPETLMYQNISDEAVNNPRFSQKFTILTAGHLWTLEIVSTDSYGVTSVERIAPIVIMITGLFVGLLLAAMLYSLLSSRQRAQIMANELSINYKEQSKRLTLATKSGGIGIWSWDVVNNKLIWDNTMYQLYGIKAEDFNGAYEAWQAGLHPEDKAQGDKDIQLALAGKKEFDTMFRVLWPNGTVHYLKAFAIVERDQAGKPITMIGVNFDITNEKEIERAKDEFVSLASHQLRTPLSIVNWYSEALQDESLGKLTKEQKEYIDEISEGNKRMTALVNSLLNVSRLDLGTFKVEPKELEVKKLIGNLKKQYANQLKDKRITWKPELDPKLKTITTDPTIINLIFDNLISNAVKYTPAKGKIMVSIHSLPKQRFEFTVSDTGYGIPKDQQDKIFSKMFRADNVASNDTTGTGLGLYMVKSIIEAVGGSISFASEQDKGTEFSIILSTKMKFKKGTSRLS